MGLHAAMAPKTDYSAKNEDPTQTSSTSLPVGCWKYHVQIENVGVLCHYDHFCPLIWLQIGNQTGLSDNIKPQLPQEQGPR